MSIEKPSFKLYVWISVCVILVLVVAFGFVFSVVGSNQKDPELGEATEEEYIPGTWVWGTARIYVLAEMFEFEEESVPVLGEEGASFRSHGGERWETNIDYFMDSGLLKEVDGNITVDTTMSVAEAGNALPGGGHDQMIAALGDTLELGEVTWCGDDIRADIFADDYVDMHYGDFDSREEYLASIEEYVECSGD